MSFQNGLSGLAASSKNLDVIGHNIANVNTVGAKAGRAQFADVYATSLYGQGSAYNGIGVTVSSVSQQFTQGDLSTSDNPLDMAVNGSGFFRLSYNGALSYSRNGEFHLDKDNYIVSSSGSRLTGYAANPLGGILVGVPVELRLNMADIAPKATEDAGIQLNLNATNPAVDAIHTTTPFDPTQTESYSGATSLTVFDRQGSPHVLSTYYQKVGDNEWNVYAVADGVPIAGPGANGQIETITFDVDGKISAPTARTPVTVPTTAAAGGFFDIELDLTELTQYGSSFAVNRLSQDGFAPGQVAGFTIGDDGTILANYTNGQTKAQGQVVLANFSNATGLSPMGGNAWQETATSGQPVVGAAKTGALGTIKSGALEGSNVDLTAELVNMITAQRSYQANAQTIKTEDQILQTIVNLR